MNWNFTQKSPVHLVLEDTALEIQITTILKKVTDNIKSFDNAGEFLLEPISQAPVCLITELSLPDTTGITLIKRIRENGLATPVIVIASKEDGVYSAVKAIRAGAADFIEQPIVERDFVERLTKVIIKMEE